METLNIENKSIDLSEVKLDTLELNVKGLCEVIILNNSFTNLIINLDQDSKLVINHFQLSCEGNSEITFNVKDKANLVYNMSHIVDMRSSLNIEMNFLGCGASIINNIHSLVSGSENIDLKGNVNANKNNNEMIENVKVILLGYGSATVKPDMLIDTNLVNAIHKVAISSLRENDLFYLRSKSISKKMSEELIKKSFLLSILTNNELKDKIEQFL